MIDFTDDEDANQLVNDLDNMPHAFVLACFMDRQIPARKAWAIPQNIRLRVGSFDIGTLAHVSEQQYIQHFLNPTKLHRYPEKMAICFSFAVHRLQTEYGGDAARLWSDRPSSGEMIYRLLQFSGVGQKIATMTANILVRHFHVQLTDKYSIDVSIDGLVPRVLKRVFGLSESADATELIYFARSLNPDYPGIIDYEAWDIGSNWCQPQNPQCDKCRAKRVCRYSERSNHTLPAKG
ncbi:MAG: iron-sulfur cluster loop [Proteobacteria bacterium]|nr:iron-sulfur cluster loop [Pseudomonadota bacterium]